MKNGTGWFCGLGKVSAIFAIVLVLGCSQNLFGQGSANGSIHGNVVDPSGAALGGVSVTVKNTQTGVTQVVNTGDEGIFSALNLPPGNYSVKTEKPGFGTKTTDNVQVSVGLTTSLTIQLAVGNVTETVNVEATLAPVTEDKGDRGVLLEAQTLEELPLQVSGGARLADTFLTLAPGVTGDTFSARINGAPNFSQDFYYDGIPYMNADGGGRQEGVGAPFESLDEYTVITNAYNAQYGRGAGLLNFHIRSGTNQLHGGGWEYLRNNVLDSKGYFSNSVPTEKQHEFGFKVGGPVYIPKVYDGRDKTFFFTNFNWFRFRGGISNSFLTLPTSDMKNGNFSSILGTTPLQVNGVNEINPCDGSLVYPGQIFDPATTQTVGGKECRTAFPGNIIPLNRLSPLSSQFVSLIPTAGSNAPTNNTLVAVPTAPQNNLFYLFKADHNISHALVFHASYYKAKFNSPTSPLISGPLGAGNNFNVLGYEPRISLDWTINPHILNQVLFSAQYTKGVRIFFPLVPSSFNSPITIPGDPWPSLGIAGEPGYGAGQENGAFSGGCWPCTYFADNVKWSLGRHSLAFGAELRWEDELNGFTRNIGSFSFPTGGTSLPSSPNSGQLGWGFASFFLGTPTSVSQSGATPNRLIQTGYRGLYFQDDIQVSKKFTLNVGLRWDASLPAWSKSSSATGGPGYFSNFDPTVPNPGAGGLPGSIVYSQKSGLGGCIPGGSSTCRDKLANTYWNNWQPRLGFAYRLNDKTTMRGGFGITSVRGGATTLMGPEIAASFLTGYQAQQSLTSNGFSIPAQIPGSTWDAGIPPVGPPPAHTLNAVNGQGLNWMRPEDGKTGYTQMWTLTLERQLPRRIAFEASYVGSASVRVGANLLNPNQVPSRYLSLGSVLSERADSADAIAAGIQIPYPGFFTDFPGSAGSVAQALRPFPMFGYISPNTQNTGHLRYHALQVRAQKYFSDGLSFLINYTYSQTVGDAIDQFSTFGSPALDAGNPKAERRILGDVVGYGGLAGRVYPRYLTAAATYELPIGPGKRYLAVHGVAGKIVGGWALSYVGGYQAGSVLPISGGSQQSLFNGPARPNLVPGARVRVPYSGKFNPRTQLYLDPAAFTDPGAFAIGNAPPTLPNARGFPSLNENFAFLKNIPVTESARFQFRADFFNAFNRVVFSDPDTNWNDRTTGGFGKVTGQFNQPRVIQFALRFDF